MFDIPTYVEINASIDTDVRAQYATSMVECNPLLAAAMTQPNATVYASI